MAERNPARARIEQALAELPLASALEQVARPSPAFGKELADAGIDRARLVIDQYEARGSVHADRKAAGVFYTPEWIVDAMLDRLPTDGEWLDPAAGAGAFLVAIARRFGPDVLSRMSACDVDSAALDAAAFAIEAALGPESRKTVEHWRKTRAFQVDFLRNPYPGPTPDTIIGNPPYKVDGSEDLSKLFPVLGGEVDLYACFLARSLQVARMRATVALLIPDTWLSNTGAQGLRRMLAEFGVSRIVDFGKPFAAAKDTRVHAVIASPGAKKCTVEATRNDKLLPMAGTTSAELRASAASGWLLYRTKAESEACGVLAKSPRLDSILDVVYGLRTGDNKKHIADAAGELPLVAGRDLEAYDRRTEARSLRNPPEFERAMRRQRGQWKIGIQRIRTNSASPWRRWVEAALMLPDEVGLDSLTMIVDRGIATEPSETLLHTLGVLNSSILNRLYRLSFTDVNVKPTYLSTLPIPKLDRNIAALVRNRLATPGNTTIERAIDRLVADAYGLSEAQIESLESGFWEGQGSALPTREEALASQH